MKSLSHVRLLVTPWTAAYQAPPSMGFSRQEYWSGVPLPSLGRPLKGSEKEWKISAQLHLVKQYSCKYPEGSLTLWSRSHHEALTVRRVVRINALVMAPKVVVARKKEHPACGSSGWGIAWHSRKSLDLINFRIILTVIVVSNLPPVACESQKLNSERSLCARNCFSHWSKTAADPPSPTQS